MLPFSFPYTGECVVAREFLKIRVYCNGVLPRVIACYIGVLLRTTVSCFHVIGCRMEREHLDFVIQDRYTSSISASTLPHPSHPLSPSLSRPESASSSSNAPQCLRDRPCHAPVSAYTSTSLASLSSPPAARSRCQTPADCTP